MLPLAIKPLILGSDSDLELNLVPRAFWRVGKRPWERGWSGTVMLRTFSFLLGASDIPTILDVQSEHSQTFRDPFRGMIQRKVYETG